MQKLAYRFVQDGHHHILFQVICSPNGGISEIELIGKWYLNFSSHHLYLFCHKITIYDLSYIGKHVLADCAAAEDKGGVLQKVNNVADQPQVPAEAKTGTNLLDTPVRF